MCTGLTLVDGGGILFFVGFDACCDWALCWACWFALASCPGTPCPGGMPIYSCNTDTSFKITKLYICQIVMILLTPSRHYMIQLHPTYKIWRRPPHNKTRPKIYHEYAWFSSISLGQLLGQHSTKTLEVISWRPQTNKQHHSLPGRNWNTLVHACFPINLTVL